MHSYEAVEAEPTFGYLFLFLGLAVEMWGLLERHSSVYSSPLWLSGDICVAMVVASRPLGVSCSGVLCSGVVANVAETFKGQFCDIAGVIHRGSA